MLKFRKRIECLADVVNQVISELELEEKFLVEVDIPEDIDLPAPAEAMLDLVRNLVQQATDQMRDGGELAFIGWESEDTCELEIADSGGTVTDRRRQSLRATQIAGAHLQWSDCPQGGAAVTVQFMKHNWQRKAA